MRLRDAWLVIAERAIVDTIFVDSVSQSTNLLREHLRRLLPCLLACLLAFYPSSPSPLFFFPTLPPLPSSPLLLLLFLPPFS